MTPLSSRRQARVLFVSLHNSARSLIAEAILGKLAPSLFKVCSCGVPGYVADGPAPDVGEALSKAGFATEGLRPKNWMSLQHAGVSPLDFVITLADSLPADPPIWQGQPVQATWAYPLVCGPGLSAADSATAIQRTLFSLHRRIELLVSLHQRAKGSGALAEDLRALAWD